MSNDRTFTTTTDYHVPLLRLLAELEDGVGQSAEICRLFQQKYERLIPQEHYGLRTNGKPIWENNTRWARNHLKDNGFLEAPERGVWRITEDGRRWLKENPDATRMHRRRRQKGRTSLRRASSSAPSVPGITLEMLEQTRRTMPPDQFREVWGTLYDQLLAQERAKAVTEITQTELGRRTRRWLDEVHAFLNGKNPSMPSSETICDWIHFCYNLELYREAGALLPYVRADEAAPAVYRRAKRVADVCRNKLSG